jgi:hypothetical protein
LGETLDRLLRFHPLPGDQFATGLACVKAVESLFQGQCSLEFMTQTRLFSGAIQIHSHPSHGSNSIRRRALELYVKRGGQSGSGLDDWLQAEEEILRAEGDARVDEASEESLLDGMRRPIPRHFGACEKLPAPAFQK